MNRYCRADVLRILHITAKQLVGWQRAGLVPISETFTFYDLLQLKKIRDLRAKRVRPAVIRESLEAMQKQVAGMENPLIEASAFSVGSRVAYRHEGHSVEPIAGQFVLDFGPVGTVVSTIRSGRLRHSTSAVELFARGRRDGRASQHTRRSHPQSIFRFWRLNPTTLPLISIWEHFSTIVRTLCPPRNTTDWLSRPTHVTRLAYFDLGNVLDETGRIPDAVVGLQHGDQTGSHLRGRPLQPGAWPTSACASPVRRCGTGKLISSSTIAARGQYTLETRLPASWKPIR